MKKSLNAWANDPKADFDAVFEQTAAAGFDGIELNFDPPDKSAHSFTLDNYKSLLPHVRELSERFALPVVSVSSSLGWRFHMGAVAAERDSVRAAFEAQLTAAKALGAGGILTLPNGVEENNSLARARENSLEFLESERSFIMDCGLIVGVENVWNGFFTSPYDMTSFIRDAGNPLIKAYFDVGNVFAFSRPQDWIEIIGSDIGFIHIKGYRRNKGINSGGEFCGITEGGIDRKAVVTALQAVGFDGYITAEVTKRIPEQSFTDFYRSVSAELDGLMAY